MFLQSRRQVIRRIPWECSGACGPCFKDSGNERVDQGEHVRPCFVTDIGAGVSED